MLLQYHGTLSNLPTTLQPSLELSSTLIASFQPESDLNALIERYRTGPFRPVTHVYESAIHDGPDVIFGIDLRKWAGQAGWNDIKLLQTDGAEPEQKETIPPVVVGLLAALKASYAKMETPAERRKTWIYEVSSLLDYFRRLLTDARILLGSPSCCSLFAGSVQQLPSK